MHVRRNKRMWALLAVASSGLVLSVAYAQEQGKTSYMKLDVTEPFASIMARMKAAKPEIEKRQADLLAERYDLSNRPGQGVTMEHDKPLQEGVRVKLPQE